MEPLLRVSQYTGVTRRERSDEEMETSLRGYRIVREGELAVNIMLAWNGSLGVSPVDGIVSPAYAVFRFRSGEPRYFHFLLRTPAAKGRIKASSRGVVDSRLRLYPDDLFRIELPKPPLEDQVAIVRYLDHIDSRIQRFIAAKERLIELLEEEKQALAADAVARHVHGRDSGTVRLKNVIGAIEQGWSPQCEAQAVVDGAQWGILKTGCVNGDEFAPSENKRLPDDLTPRPELSVKKGDIVMSRANTRQLLGRAVCIEADYPNLMLSDKLYRFRPAPDMARSDFLALALRQPSVRSQIEARTTGASDSMQNISQAIVRELTFWLPPVSEQARIVKRIEDERSRTNAVQARARREVELMREYRVRLVTDVVTGKVDVRGPAQALAEARNGDLTDLGREYEATPT